MHAALDVLRVLRGDAKPLAHRETRITPPYTSKTHYQALLNKHVRGISTQQSLLYANAHHAVLLIVQGMDASGKDGLIKHVMSGVNPQGCSVVSFKTPSAAELRHDFLWRSTVDLPQRGQIGIFNRSYYEEVLIARVHKRTLENEQLAPDELHDHDIWKSRFRSITDYERHLTRNGTRIVKVFLHLSKDEQKRRFLKRLDNPAKQWKLDSADIAERSFWDDYMQAYTACLGETSTEDAPWYVVPADNKRTARLLVAQILLSTLKELDIALPAPDAQRLDELKTLRAQLVGKDR